MNELDDLDGPPIEYDEVRDQLPDDRQKFPDEIFDENFLNFWSGIDLPKGPPLQQILNHEPLT